MSDDTGLTMSEHNERAKDELAASEADLVWAKEGGVQEEIDRAWGRHQRAKVVMEYLKTREQLWDAITAADNIRRDIQKEHYEDLTMCKDEAWALLLAAQEQVAQAEERYRRFTRAGRPKP